MDFSRKIAFSYFGEAEDAKRHSRELKASGILFREERVKSF
jgi:hypothetical protein